jgi:hypothetical protein
VHRSNGMQVSSLPLNTRFIFILLPGFAWQLVSLSNFPAANCQANWRRHSAVYQLTYMGSTTASCNKSVLKTLSMSKDFSSGLSLLPNQLL